jgi:sugar phosphate isomerase/epimerase
VRLGVENRYHHMDLPSLDEMGELLGLADADRLGFLYDVGHAQTLDRLGFYSHEEWLKRYGSRIIGVHLHDALGVEDHRMPGLAKWTSGWWLRIYRRTPTAPWKCKVSTRLSRSKQA